MDRNTGPDAILVHSPRIHQLSTTVRARLSSCTSESDSRTNSENGDSDVSDMIVENVSRFEHLSKQRRKSGGSDYQPLSDSNGTSESESESASNASGSFSGRHNFASLKEKSGFSGEDSEGTSNRSSPVPLSHHGQNRVNSLIVRKSPLSVAHRSSPSDVTTMRGHRYSMLPSRSVALNVNYCDNGDEDSDPGFPARVGRKKRLQLKESESEFEMSYEESDESISEEMSSSEDLYDEDNYRPPRRKARGARRKVTSEISGSDSDYVPGGVRKRHGKGSKKLIRRRNEGYRHSFVSDGGMTGSSSESEFEPGYASKQRKKKNRLKGEPNRDVDSPSDFTRTTGRSKGIISYKDFYGSEVEEGEEEEGVNEMEMAVPPVEDNRENIERILRKRMGRVGDTGDKTTCYAQCLAAGSDPDVLACIGRGDKESVAKLTFSFNTPSPPPGEPTEVQYLVKWQKWSHLHNTWETENSLTSRDVRGMKKFHNFLKREEERELWEKEANPEDLEYVKCQEQLADQLLEQFTQVERVIAARTTDEGAQEYLCKWRGLPYSECTWEDGNLVSGWFQREIDGFIERNASDCIPNKNAKVLRHRPKFIYVKEQLKSLGGPGRFKLRDYQLEGVNWLIKSWCKNNSVILADEMGLGKTIQTIAFLHSLFHTHQLYGPFLIVVPLSTMPSWQREFELWAPEMNTVVYIGDINSRSKIREHEWSHPNKKLKFNSILTTYEILLKDKDFLGSVAWSSLIVDEAHRLKNDNSLLYRTLMEFRTNNHLLITGTPLQNSLKELWSLLHFIMEKKFPSWEDFEYEHQAYGEEDASNLISIHQQLQPYLLRRIKKDVEKSLPAKVEQILRVEMSSVQKQYYKWILTKNYKALSKGVKGSITGFINIMMELKKCCNHVWIVRSPDEKEEQAKDKLQTLIRGSGKLYLLDKLLVRLNQTGHRVLIFSQMVRMLDVLAEYMRLRHFHFQRLDGSVRGDLRKDAIDHFNAEGSQDFCFLLSTRAGGLGVNLATADTVVIFDSDWNPQNDLQAQARAHRIGQKKQVNIYRLVTKNSVEEDIIERAKKKMVLDHLVIQRMDTTGRTVLSTTSEPNKSVPFDKEELSAILKFGAEELFKSGDGGGTSGDKELQDMDIDDILSRAEMQTTSEASSHNDLLSQFNVASFAVDEEELAAPPVTPTDGKLMLLSPVATHPVVDKSWDELIPEEARRKMEEDEKTREQMELYLPPRQRKVQNYCEDQSQKASSSGKPRGRNTRGGGEAVGKDSTSSSGYTTILSKNIRGFTDAEIRRFIKSYRKFVNPKTRLGMVAADAELKEKSLSELQRLMTVLHDGCVQAEEEHRARMEIEVKYNPKKDKGASLRLCGVTISSTSLLRREEELAVLASVIPANPAVRKKYRLLSRPKGVHWEGVKWTAVDDAKLLVGVYELGMGNWESIRDDPSLGLSNKILPADTSLKPQPSHLQTRVEYLLKLMQAEAAEKMRKKSSKTSSRSKVSSSHFAKSKGQSKVKAKKPSRHTAAPDSTPNSHLTVNISRELLEREGDSDTGSSVSGRRTSSRRRKTVSSQQQLPRAKRVELGVAEGGQGKSKPTGSRSRGRKQKVFIPGERTSPRKRKVRGDGGGNDMEKVEGVAERGKLSDLEDSSVELDDDTFKKCKSLLKPVKKCMLDLQPREESAERDPSAMNQFKEVLVEIGDHIISCLSDYDPEDSSLWKTNLWVFVSKFTKASPQKLHRIYKKAKKSPDFLKLSPSLPPKKRALDNMSHDSSSHSDHTSSHKPHPSKEKYQSSDIKETDEPHNQGASHNSHKTSINEGTSGSGINERDSGSIDSGSGHKTSHHLSNEGDSGSGHKTSHHLSNEGKSGSGYKTSHHPSNEGDSDSIHQHKTPEHSSSSGAIDHHISSHRSSSEGSGSVHKTSYHEGGSGNIHKTSSSGHGSDQERRRHSSRGFSDHHHSSGTRHERGDYDDAGTLHQRDRERARSPHHHHSDHCRDYHGDHHRDYHGDHHRDHYRDHNHHGHHQRRRHHSSGSDYYSDTSSSKRPRYHSPPHQPPWSPKSSYDHNSHSHY